MQHRTPDLHAIAALQAARAAARNTGRTGPEGSPPTVVGGGVSRHAIGSEVELAQAAQARRELRRLGAQEPASR